MKLKKFIVFFVMLVLLSGCSYSSKNNNKVNQNNDSKMQKSLSKPSSDRSSDNKDEISAEEREFNNSGRAKAIENEEDLWKLYENVYSKFFLRYPHHIALNGQESESSLNLTIINKKIDTLEDTMGFNKETALKNKESLSQGEYGEDVDFPLAVSKKVKKIEDKNAQEFMVLGRFEICDVKLERKLYFFKGDYQVLVTLSIDPEIVKKEMAEYFTVNEDNCGSDLIWNFDKQEEFYNILKNGNGGLETQELFNTFDRIVNTIKFQESVKKINFDQIQGLWTSIDDSKSTIAFLQNKKVDFYDGEKMTEEKFKLLTEDGVEDENGEYIEVEMDEEVSKYHVDKVTDTELELTYLDRGNVLKYKK